MPSLFSKLLTLNEILRMRSSGPDRRRGDGNGVPALLERRKGRDRRHSLRSIGLFSLLWCGLAAPASAQIFSWTDANGRLVVSDKPQHGQDTRSYSVAKSESVRVTRFVTANRVQSYDDVIVEHARLNGIRPDLVRAVVQVESAYNPYAKSPKGAIGLMQLMPGTAKELGVINPFNPVENIRGGVAYLRRLLDRYDNNEQLALAAYNAGPNAVDRYGATIPPYRETQNYVSRVKRIAGPATLMAGTKIFKVVEIINGRETVRYTDKAPK
jgi:hypothetical protein